MEVYSTGYTAETERFGQEMESSTKKIIQGFGLTFGITVTFLGLLVILPLSYIVIYTLKLSPERFFQVIFSKRVVTSFALSLSSALIVTLVNTVMGVVIAFVLVRYEFPGKRIMDSLIEIPFALPTSVAGISLTALYGERGVMGKLYSHLGISVDYTRLGIIIALTFVSIPYVVRSVEPVLNNLDHSIEEAAGSMGASRSLIFRRVIFPEIAPAVFSGAALSFGRCLGEYGSVVFIAGNMPYKTEIVPIIIMSRLQEFNYSEASAIAFVMLIFSFMILFISNIVSSHNIKIKAGIR